MSLIRTKISNRKIFSKWKNQVNVFSTSGVGDNHPNVVKSDSKDVAIPEVTITEFIYNKIGSYSKYIATESAATGRNFTFEQIRVKSRNLSKNLRHKFKLNDGDVIGFFLPNRPEYMIGFLGSLEARLIVTTMNHIYTPDEISKQITDSSAKVIITQASHLNTLRSSFNIIKRDIPTIIIKERQDESLPENTIDFFELTDTAIDIPDFQPGNSTDVAIMPYSSGTTGLPKGVQLIHKNMVANISQMESEDFTQFKAPTENSQDVTPAVLPFYHIYGMVLNFLFLSFGVKTVALDKFTPESYIAALQKYSHTSIFAAPPLVLFLTGHPGVKSEYFKNLRLLSCGAAPLGYQDELRFIKKVGRSDFNLVQGYGLTETSPIVTHSPNKSKRTEKNGGSVGKLLPNTSVKIINPEDPQGSPLGPLEKGELLIKGPQVMKGYYNRPEDNKIIFMDGWLRTGDIGYYNDEHYFFISDRLKELIKVKGFQVAPAELEEIIRDHPSVEEACVIGIPDDKQGEIPRAFVNLKKGKTLNLEDLDKFVSEKVASYKKLAGGIELVETIPKNPSGKILRRIVKEEYMKRVA